jgi:spermidine synthase
MQQVLWEGDTKLGHYQVVDTPYDGRPARVLYSGNRQAAQSGIPRDGNPDLLFDYNQRLIELTTSLIPSRVLIIGGGVFTLPTALLRAMPELKVDVVEIDDGLTQLAYDFFDMPVDERLAIFNKDGRSFLDGHATRYDMIIVDAFTNTTIPKEIRTLQAFQSYANHLRPDGVLAMNVISGFYGPSSQTLKQMYAAAMQSHHSVETFLASHGYSLWLPQNFILTAQKEKGSSLADFMRYDALKPPDYRFETIPEDET